MAVTLSAPSGSGARSLGVDRLLALAAGCRPQLRASQHGDGDEQRAGAKDFNQELHGSVLGCVARDLLDQPVGVSRGAKGEGHTCCETKDKHRSYAVVFTVAALMVCRFPQTSELPAITAFEAVGSGI